ncbi:hypothetical protein OROHE_020200 [Orobanche hederae]
MILKSSAPWPVCRTLIFHKVILSGEYFIEDTVRSSGWRRTIYRLGIEMGRGNGSVQEEYGNGKLFEGC